MTGGGGLIDGPPDPPDQYACSGCGRWVPCRHCPDNTPTRRALTDAELADFDECTRLLEDLATRRKDQT